MILKRGEEVKAEENKNLEQEESIVRLNDCFKYVLVNLHKSHVLDGGGNQGKYLKSINSGILVLIKSV